MIEAGRLVVDQAVELVGLALHRYIGFGPGALRPGAGRGHHAAMRRDLVAAAARHTVHDRILSVGHRRLSNDPTPIRLAIPLLHTQSAEAGVRAAGGVGPGDLSLAISVDVASAQKRDLAGAFGFAGQPIAPRDLMIDQQQAPRRNLIGRRVAQGHNAIFGHRRLDRGLDNRSLFFGKRTAPRQPGGQTIGIVARLVQISRDLIGIGAQSRGAARRSRASGRR